MSKKFAEYSTDEQRNIKRVGIGVAMIAMLGVGIGVGANSAGGESDASSQKVKTVTKTETPKACLTALDQSRNIFSATVDFTDIVAVYLPMIAEAGMAGLEQDIAQIEDITERINDSNKDLEALNVRVHKYGTAFDAAAVKCES